MRNERIRVGFVLTDRHNFKPFKNHPLVELYLMTILEQDFKDKIDISLIDLRGITPENIIYHIPEKDIYFYSAFSPDILNISLVIKEIKKIYPSSKHIGGGIHINLFPQESSTIFDVIALGESEEAIKRIIIDYSNSNLKKTYQQQEEIDINLYPYPLRKFIPSPAVIQKGLLTREYSDLLGTSVLFSRGCPFNCHFCSNLIRGKIRFRSPKLITEEIEYLKKEYAIEGVVIKDDNSIPVNRDIAIGYLNAIKKAGIKWRGQSRANGIQRDIVRLAKEAGCLEIAPGVESVEQKVLEIINKKLNLNEAKNYLKMLREEGIDTKLLLMMGLPGESDNIAKETLDFIKEVKPSSVLLSFFQPLPGSRMYNHPEEFGIKIDSTISFDKYATAFGRFDKNELPVSVFEYEKMTPFGKGKSVEQRVREYIEVQDYLRENNLTF